MNWVDGSIVILLGYFVYESFGRNVLSEILDALSFLIAFFASLRFYNVMAEFFIDNFKIPDSLAKIFGFLTVWLLVEVVFFTLTHIILIRSIRVIHFSKLANYFSFIPALLRGLVFISIILVLLGTFPIQPRIKQDIHESAIGSLILNQTFRLESPLKGVFGGIAEDTFTFLTIKPKSDETINLGFKTAEFNSGNLYESQLIGLVNKERSANNLQSLIEDPMLTKIARMHSADMFKRGYFAHNSPEGENVSDRAIEAHITFLVIGENLAYAPSIELAHTGLMNSQGHRANILSGDFGRIGIGIMDGGVYGLMVTQVFSN